MLGFVVSRVLYSYLPSVGGNLHFEPRFAAWGIILAVMAIVVLVSLRKEGSHQAVWVVFLFLVYLSFYGKSLGLVDNFSLRDGELVSAVELDEHGGDFDRATQLLEWAKSDRPKDEQQAIDSRIAGLRSRKTEWLSHSQ
jgi:hypothetical protein